MERYSTLVVLGIVVLLSGCSDPPDPSLAAGQFNKTNIRRLRNCYEMYLQTHDFVGPESEEALKDYLKNDRVAQVRLKRMEIEPDQIDAMFVSDRDGKPFKVRWGVKGQADHAVVFEEEGVDGKRLVGLLKPREMGAEEYEGYWTGRIKPEFADGVTEDDSGEADKQQQENIDDGA